LSQGKKSGSEWGRKKPLKCSEKKEKEPGAEKNNAKQKPKFGKGSFVRGKHEKNKKHNKGKKEKRRFLTRVGRHTTGGGRVSRSQPPTNWGVLGTPQRKNWGVGEKREQEIGSGDKKA